MAESDGDTTQAAGQIPEDIETRVEKLVRESLDEHDIPGASVAVVRDGTTTLAEGYGVADRETGRPAEATTPFRLGSVSKPIVATAVARLVERGELDPHRPVREYLDDDLVSWDEPVTLAQLVTHTAGFETTNLNMWYDDPAEVRALPDHLDPMATQVRSPGTLGAYSNHGYAVAGQVLAAVSGSPFPDTMAELLFSPAGMDTASFRQPLPDDLQEAHARGHDGEVDSKFAGLGIAPAGAMSASAVDVGRFMELQLDDGSVDDEQVLDPETVELVQRQWFSHHDALDGMTFGFVEDQHGGTRMLRHTGGTPLDVFWTELRLIPELGFGLYLSFNAEAREPLEAVADEITEEITPTAEVDVPEPDGDPERADELEGSYRSLRRSFETHNSFLSTLGTTVEVDVADDGALLVEMGGETARYVEAEPLVFRDEETAEPLAFGEHDGELYLFTNGSPTALEPVSRYQSELVYLLTVLVPLVGVTSGWILWGPDRDEGETRREWARSLRSNRPRQAKFAAHGASTLFELFLIAFLWSMSLDFQGVFTEPRLAFRALFALSILGAVGTVAAAVLTVRVWQEGYWQRRVRIHYTFVVASLVALTVFLWRWNLLFPP